jgi:hypothetical protein
VAISRGAIPADSFTIISNAWLRDPALSFKVKGLLAYIASHAAGYRLTLDQIVAETKDGLDAVRATIADAKAAGYLRSIEVRNHLGHRIGTDYELCEPAQVGKSQVGKVAPSPDQQERDVSAGQPQMGKSQVGKSDPKKTTPPTEVKKTTEKTPSASPRGTRLPADWRPSSDLGDWLLAKLPEGRWSDHSRRWVLHETEKFSLYWTTKTGRDATKIDWDATWRRWMLTALERYRPAATGNAAPAAGQFKTSAEKQADKAQRDKVRGQLVDELIGKGIPVQEAFDAVEAELRRREALGEVITLDACLVPGYIDAKVIDVSTTATREVTA